jgi:hypothetical protein
MFGAFSLRLKENIFAEPQEGMVVKTKKQLWGIGFCFVTSSLLPSSYPPLSDWIKAE